jgi:amino acid transporter
MDTDQITSARSEWPGQSHEPGPLPLTKGNPVQRVLIGAVLGVIAGAIVAAIPSYHLTINATTSTPTGFVRQNIDLADLVRAIATIVIPAAGGIIGAIAGLASNSRSDRPLIPRWVLLVIVAVLLFLMIGSFGFFWLRTKQAGDEFEKTRKAAPADVRPPADPPGDR